MLQVALDGFCRQATTVFTSSLRTVCAVTLTSIEQRTYAEYVDSLDELDVPHDLLGRAAAQQVRARDPAQSRS